MSIKLACILALLLLTTAAQAQPPIDCKTNQRGPFADLCVHETTVGRIVTIDLKIKEEHGRTESIVVDIPNSDIRRTGFILQLYYNSAAGNAQWSPYRDTRGIYVFPGSIQLPVQRWIKRGLAPGQLIRVVLLFGE